MAGTTSRRHRKPRAPLSAPKHVNGARCSGSRDAVCLQKDIEAARRARYLERVQLENQKHDRLGAEAVDRKRAKLPPHLLLGGLKALQLSHTAAVVEDDQVLYYQPLCSPSPAVAGKRRAALRRQLSRRLHGLLRSEPPRALAGGALLEAALREAEAEQQAQEAQQAQQARLGALRSVRSWAPLEASLLRGVLAASPPGDEGRGLESAGAGPAPPQAQAQVQPPSPPPQHPEAHLSLATRRQRLITHLTRDPGCPVYQRVAITRPQELQWRSELGVSGSPARTLKIQRMLQDVEDVHQRIWADEAELAAGHPAAAAAAEAAEAAAAQHLSAWLMGPEGREAGGQGGAACRQPQGGGRDSDSDSDSDSRLEGDREGASVQC